MFFCLFKQKTAYEMRISDWSSDVCSSDLTEALAIDGREPNRLYVWVLGDGLYRSDDAAESWQRVDDGPKQQEIRSLISLNEPTGMGGIWLYAGLDVGIVKSPDCFCGWDRLTKDRKSVVEGKHVAVRVDLGGRRCIKKKTIKKSK